MQRGRRLFPLLSLLAVVVAPDFGLNAAMKFINVDLWVQHWYCLLVADLAIPRQSVGGQGVHCPGNNPPQFLCRQYLRVNWLNMLVREIAADLPASVPAT